MPPRVQSDPQPADPRLKTKPIEDAATSLLHLDSSIFKEVQVDLKARLGEVKMTVEDLLALRPGSVVTLEAGLNDLVELRLNDSVVARGEIVAVGANFGLRIVEIGRSS